MGQLGINKLDQPVDGAGLAAFRILFGALMVFSTVRFAAYGWIDELYLSPTHHFTYLGFEWVRPWPGAGMYVHFAVMGLAAVGLMLGAWTRLSALVFGLCFTYVELIDKTTYLNHYYFVSLVVFLLLMTPCARVWSVDAWRSGGKEGQSVPLWTHWALRIMVALVYFYAGFAKLSADWLLNAQPMHQWLSYRSTWPVVGPLMDDLWLALAMSWAGAIYDLTIFGWLMWRPTRRWAYASVVFFHVVTWMLFPIGVFPWVMIASATIFFDLDWPRALVARLRGRFGTASTPETPHWPALEASGAGSSGARAVQSRWGRVSKGIVAVFLVGQILIPLRFALYPGPVNWTEEGFRFAWRVMLIEKRGMVEFEVRTASPERRWTVYPRDHLTPAQVKALSTQPDIILQYAHHIAKQAKTQGFEGVEVHAHAWTTFNGRPSQRFIDPDVDLAARPISLEHKDWILPLETP